MKIGDIEVVTLRTAAEMLGLSRKTLVAQAKKGVLRATMEGSIYLVPVEEIERYRAEHLGKRGNYDHTTARRLRRRVKEATASE